MSVRHRPASWMYIRMYECVYIRMYVRIYVCTYVWVSDTGLQASLCLKIGLFCSIVGLFCRYSSWASEALKLLCVCTQNRPYYRGKRGLRWSNYRGKRGLWGPRTVEAKEAYDRAKETYDRGKRDPPSRQKRPTIEQKRPNRPGGKIIRQRHFALQWPSPLRCHPTAILFFF